MKQYFYKVSLVCSILLGLFSKSSQAQVAINADSTNCASTSLTMHASLLGDAPTSAGITADDGYGGVISIGFTFNFYGTNYTQCVIGSNGQVNFTTSVAGSYDPWPISAALLGNSSAYNCINGPWCDMYIPSGGTITYSTIGTAPNRKFMVTWCAVHMYDCTAQWNTSQVIMYETTNVVEVHTGHHTGTTCTYWNGGYAITGVQNATGTAATVAPGRDFPTAWTVVDESWRFSPNATLSAYTCSSIPYAPVPYASSAIYWYDSTTGAFLGSGPTLTVTPTTPTTYKAGAIGCSDTSWAFYHALPVTGSGGGTSGGSPHISSSPHVNPSYCGMCDGSIILNGIHPHQIDTVFWSMGGVVQPPIIDSAGADSVITLSALCAGVYDYIYVKVGNCPSNTVGPITLTTPPIVIAATFTQPTMCGACNGTISVHGCHPGQTVSINYSLNGTPQPAWVGVAGTDSIITMTGMCAGAYTAISVTAGVSCVSNTVAGPLTLISPPLTSGFTFNANHLGCHGDTVIFTNTSSPAGFTSYWHFGDGSAVDSVSTNPAHIYYNQGTYTIKLLYSDYGYCWDSTIVTIPLIHPIEAIFTPTPASVCLGTSITFANTSIGGSPTYFWSFGDGSTGTDVSPVHTYTAPGQYTVNLHVTDFVPCTSDTTMPVTVTAVYTHTEFHDTTVCLRTPMTFNGSAIVLPSETAAGNTYSWTPATNLSSPNSASTQFSGVGTYVYTFTATSLPLGCEGTDVLTIHSMPPITLTNLTVDQSISLGSSVQLNASGAAYFWWSPDNGTLSNPNINNPLATPTDSVTTYRVIGMSQAGCLDTAYITIRTGEGDDEIIPGGFTPNNDGLNDVFRIVNLKHQKLDDFRIFNRWGREVFHTSDPTKGWDGTLNGEPQDLGVYYYQIILSRPDGTQKTYTGSVTLIR